MAYKAKVNKDIFPDGKEIFSLIKDLCRWGHRKTGTPEGRKSAEYIESKMKEFGLEDVVIETVPSLCMSVDDYSLTFDNEKMDVFFINGTNRGAECGQFSFGTNGEKNEFVYVGKGLPEDYENTDVAGKIAVVSVYLPEGDAIDYESWFKNPFVYDPENNFGEIKRKVDIYSPSIWPNNYYLAQKHGAVGFVGILENYMDDPFFYNEDYTENGWAMGCETMKLPALWTSRSSGMKIKEKFKQSEIITGQMTVDTLYEYRSAFNISGRLKGKSDDIILVHSHHDAVFEGAVQDASGISEMLSIAKYYAAVPEEEREKTLMFAALDTHYTDYAANTGFIKKRKESGDNILLDIAIEHIGKEAAFDENYNLYETGEVEARVFYVSEPRLYNFVKDTVVNYDLKKSVVALVPVGNGLDQEYEFEQDEVISDAFYFNESGVPVVSMVCGEQYLFHISDTPERIPVEELKPVGMAFAEIAGEAMKTL